MHIGDLPGKTESNSRALLPCCIEWHKYLFSRVRFNPFSIIGNLQDTLPAAAEKCAGTVVLAHSDVGSMDKEHNAYMSGLVSQNLAPALAVGAIVMSDLPLEIPGCSPHPLPGNARDDRYYLYTKTR